MFGYVSPVKGELKVRELALYNAYYCGLCRTIGRRYGQMARLLLNYDCTFFAMLLSAGNESAPCTPRRCCFKPAKGKQPVRDPDPALDFAADLNVLLAIGKLEDDMRDEHRLRSAAALPLLRRAGRRAAARRPEAAEAVALCMERLGELESAKCRESDAVADTFAALSRKLGELAPTECESERRTRGELLYNLGRWIYLFDAWDDREKDKASGAYNVFGLTGASAEKASFLLHISLNRAACAYDLMDIRSCKGILDNILFEACPLRTRRLTEVGTDESI